MRVNKKREGRRGVVRERVNQTGSARDTGERAPLPVSRHPCAHTPCPDPLHHATKARQNKGKTHPKYSAVSRTKEASLRGGGAAY